ncbi:DNRLRE domain-containing protein [Microbispora sp. NPDC046973]|uniref:DNRLRE domain-containing protein n=1 Tax=Microbispora sp. NPDC046973 TaxID=3155022 RepID=UPI0033CD21B7
MPISRARKLLPSMVHGRFSRAWVGAVVALGVFVAGIGVPDGLVTAASAATETRTQQERSVESRPVVAPTPHVKAEEASHQAKKPPAPVWPKSGSARVDVVAGKAVAVPGLPVAVAAADAAGATPSSSPSVSPSPAPSPTSKKSASGRDEKSPKAEASQEPVMESPASVTVQTFDNTVARKVGGVGMVLQLTRADGGTSPAAAKVTVDYSSFRGAGGGGFASRLTLVRLPACVLAQPLTAECAKQRSAQQRVLPVVNDVKTSHLTAEVEVAPAAGGAPTGPGSAAAGGAQATPAANASAGAAAAGDTAADSTDGFVYAVAASAAATAEGSLVGDFSASPLKPSGTWQAGQSGGAFTYSYPITAPPAPSGDAPKLALQYSSAAVDSLTSQTNNQSGLVGMGWDLNTGFIERSFVSCSGYAKSGRMGYNTAQVGWPDKCWESPYGDPTSSKLTLSLDGHSTDIVKDTSGKWRTVEDYGWKIEPMSSQSWWRITTQDGTVYRFGYNTDSSLAMAFIGDDDGEPCHQYYPEPGSGESEVEQLCEKPWRWMLDQEVDPNGNVFDYSYDKEDDEYCTVALGDFNNPCAQYDRAVNVSAVSYGGNINVDPSPTARIIFTTSDRASSGVTDEPEFCEDGDYSDCWFGTGPRFYTSRKLTSITTQTVIPGTSNWEDVTRWDLSYQWLDGGGWNGDQYPILWLDSIQQVGLAGGNGTQIALPPTTFEATFRNNAVSIELDPVQFPRINGVNNGLGGRSEVEYGQENPCPEMAQYPPTDIWDDSGYDCYFITTRYDYVNDTKYYYGEVYAKWLVKSVTDIDMVGGSPSKVTSYSYEDDPGWAIPDNPLAVRDPFMRDDYTEWRGYGQVTTTVGGGSGSSGVSTTSAKFFRGMSGRSVTDFDGNSYPDRIELNGRTLQEQARDSNGENSSTRYEYKVTGTGTGPGTRDPFRVDQTRKVTREKATTGWRYTDTKTTYNSDGLPDTVNDYGDTSTASDNTCTKITYARNTTAWMLNYHASEEKHAGDDCTTGELLSRTVYLYDGASDPSANVPTHGNVTETRAYRTNTDYATSKSTFDNYGRPLTTTDPRQKTTTTTYNPAVGWPNDGVTVKNPLEHTVTTWSSRYNGQPVGMRDANNNNVNIDYDVLGRTLQLWTPDAPKPARDDTDLSDNPPAAKVAYTVTASQPSRTMVSHLQSGAGTRTPTYTSTYTYSDGFGREREVQTASPTGGRIVQVTTYNERGLTERTSAPVYNVNAPGSGLLNPAWSKVPQWSKQEYDRLGRITAQVDMTADTSGEKEFRRTTTNYLGADKYEVIPPVGGKTVYYTDAADQVTKIEEWLSGGGSGQQAAAVAGPVPPGSSSNSSAATASATSQAAPAQPSSSAASSGAGVAQPEVGAAADAALKAAVKQGKRVQVEAATTDSSVVYANPDGKTFTAEFTAGPSRVKQGQSWVPIDTSLVEDGLLRPKAAAAQVEFSTGGTGVFAKMTRQDGTVFALSWPSALPRPQVKGNTATYADAAGPGADLVVTALATGFRHDVVLRRRPSGPVEYRLPVETSGLTLKTAETGGLTLSDKGGTVVAAAPTPVMWASSTPDAGADAKGKRRPRKRGKITTSVVQEQGHQVLVLQPDPGFLADPATTYPVTIDPTTTLPLSSDTYVIKGESSTHAGDSELAAGAVFNFVGVEVARSYLKFDTSSLAGATVSSATLSAYQMWVDSFECPTGGIVAARVTSSWNPSTVLWTNKPTTTTSGQATASETGGCSGDRSMSWKVTSMAQAWASGTANYGIELRGTDESNAADYEVGFASSEAGYGDPPTLSVTYTLPSAPAASKLSITPVTGSAVSSLTPTLHATVSDPAGGNLRADYEIEHDPAYTAEGTGQIWAGSSATVTSGNDAPATVPAGKLTDGWHIRWRARATNTGASVSSAWSAWQTTTVNVPDPLVDQFQVTPSQVLSGETVTSTLTPALAARVTTPDAGASRVEFELEHDPADTAHGTGSIWTIGNTQTGTAKSAAAGAAPAANAPASKAPTADAPASQVQDARGSASVEAKRSGKPVEVAGLTSATSSTVANPDGKTFTTTVSTRPARVKRDGAWVPIDTSLVDKDGVLVPKAGPVVKVSNGGDGPFATVADQAGNSIELSWPTPLPKPTVERNKARYADAAGPGADLVVTVLPGGVRHDIELRERPTAQLNYRINVKTTGWKLQQDGQGRLTLTDSAGKLVAPVAQPVMYPVSDRGERKAGGAQAGTNANAKADARTKGATGRHRRMGRIATRLTGEGDHQVLELTPDAAFLADPTLTYPVTVDPTVDFSPQADTYVANWDSVGDTHADDTYLDIGVDGGDVTRGYLNFDTSFLTGATVAQAQLSLNNYGAPQCVPFGSGIQVRRVTSAWDPYTVTWNSQPYATSEDAVARQDAYDYRNCPDNGMGGITVAWDVTGIAQDWAAGQLRYGLQMRAADESADEDWRVYDSSEGAITYPGEAQAPELTVTYTLPSSPTVGNLSITPSAGGAVSSLTPTLHATVSDSAGGNLRADYEIEHDPAYTGEGTGQIWAGSSAGVTSGNDAPAVVPAGKLTAGWHIRWRARATNTGTSTSSAWSAWQAATISAAQDPVVDNVASGTQATLSVPAGKLGDGWKVRWRARAVAAGSNTSAWSGWQALTVKVPAAAISQLQITPAQTTDGHTVVSSLTPQLLATVTDAYGQPLRAEFELEHDPADTQHGTGQIWATAVDNIASGTQASVTVPAGKLNNAWGIRWRVRALNTATQVTSAWSDWQTATVDIGNVPSEPAVTALQVAPSQVIDGTTVTSSLTPQLLAQVTNPAGGTMRAEFELEHDPADTEHGTGQIWTTGVDDVPAGTQATVTVPADTLSEGWLVRWRARAVAGEAASTWSDWQTVRVDQPDPVLGTLQVTPSEVVDGKTISSSLTPQLLAQVTDPAGGKVRAEFELEHDPAAPEDQGTGQIWTTAVDDVISGTQASVTVPDGKLSDGWVVRWRARVVTSGGTSAWSDWQQLTVTDGSLIPVVDNPRTRPGSNGTTTTLTPALLATVSSAQGGQLGAEFEVEHDPADTAHGTGQIWTTSVNGVTSGNDATVTVPAGTLSNGWKVRWHARAVKNGIASDWTAWQSVTVSVPNHYDTTFEYDREGQMVRQTDANGNVRTFTYNLLGRRIGVHDPDAGDSQQAYDDAGNLLWSTNGKGQKVSYSYDDIGRQTAQWAGERDSGAKLAEWVYDTATNGKGKLTSATRYAGGNAYVDTITGYDEMGRPTGSTLTIPSSEGLLAGTYTFATTYTTTGEVATYTMPAGGGLPAETLTSTYTDLDLFSRMTSGLGGGFTYVDSTTYSGTARLTDRAYGTGGKIKRHLEWDPATGWVKNVTTTTKADTSGPVTAQDDRYDYDLSGEITKILDAAAASGGSAGQYECFTYDGLHRLSQAWTTTASACGTSTAAADNQGIDPYAQSFAYDGVGNLTSLTSNGQAAIYDYPQSGTDAVRPNAVTSIARPGGTDTYAYDNAGQLTSRTVGGKAGAFSWNELGQLEKATIDGQDTTMVYDADGERLIRRDPGGKATLYLGSMEIEINGSAITGKRYYTTPDGATVAMRTGGDGVTWLMSGLHGSTQLAVNDTTGKVSRERYLPFGQRRGADDLPFTDHGFLGKVEDESTGLDYLSARYYDPTIAKFTSTDPLLDFRKAQWANPYSYAGNNPIGLSDPTGLSIGAGGASFDSCTTAAQCDAQKCIKQYGAVKCAELEKNKAAKAEGDAWDSIVGIIKELAKIAADELGITDGINCVLKGDISACSNTALNILSSLAGGIAGKIATKYGLPWKWKKAYELGERLAGLVKRGIEAVKSWLNAKSALKKAEDAYQLVKKTCKLNSFVAGTEVMLADGSSRPIESIKAGDSVLATDPATGKTTAKTVAAAFSGNNYVNLVQITVDTDGNHGRAASTITATEHHLFWDSAHHAWVRADELTSADRLRLPDGRTLRVISVSPGRGHPVVYDLTVVDLHTYYVLAGVTPILVHNSNGACGVLPTPKVSDRKLQNLVNYLYKGTGNPNLIGDGTTMSAAQHELRGGALVQGRGHIQKAREAIRALENWMDRNPGASEHDMLVARTLRASLQDALRGRYMDGTG